jgi:hypothetical protein
MEDENEKMAKNEEEEGKGGKFYSYIFLYARTFCAFIFGLL